MAKWLSRDPIGERGGKNLFCFVRNVPSRIIDVLGLLPPGQTSSGICTAPYGLCDFSGGTDSWKHYDDPDSWRKLPDDSLRGCCTKEMIDNGKKVLDQLYADAKSTLSKLGAVPAPYGEPGASCINSSSEILSSFYNNKKFPRCWACRIEGRRAILGLSQHATIVCKTYAKDGSSPLFVMYDWWGDTKNNVNHSGGDPECFYNDYPNNCGVHSGVLWEPQFYSDCSGDGNYWHDKNGLPHMNTGVDWNSLIVIRKGK